jgi:hypothetical protein
VNSQKRSVSNQKLTRYRGQFEPDVAAYWAKRGRATLIELANLRDDSCERFRRRCHMLHISVKEDDSVILHFRDQLRRLWRKEKEEDRVAPLHEWLDHSRVNGQQTWSVATNSDGTYSVEPRYSILPLTLALSASVWQAKMGVCENPSCSQKYFLKDRRTQLFCDREVCAAYGQRQHKLNWWNKNRKKLNTRRSKKL